MLCAFHVETNVDQGGVCLFCFFSWREIFSFSSRKIQELRGGNHPLLLPLNPRRPSSSRTPSCPPTYRHGSAYHLSGCVGIILRSTNSSSDVEETQSACDHLKRLESGKEIQIFGKRARRVCSALICFASQKLFKAKV